MEPTPAALGHDSRLEFQLERFILFTDAVFAIAITLLVIEIKVLDFGHPLTNREMWAALVPRFIGFLSASLQRPATGWLTIASSATCGPAMNALSGSTCTC